MIDHAGWMRAAAEEYRRSIEMLARLDDEEWGAPTDCAGWAVRDIVAHLAGAARYAVSKRELLRQARLGKRLLPDRDRVDAMNELQVRERAEHEPAQLLAELAAVAPRAVRARARVPRSVRAVPVPFGPPLGTKPLGYLLGCILTRDVWLHRVDIARAVGDSPQLTADHDARIVADVVAEWARLHGEPYELTLTGPAGGRWSEGARGERIELDAVEFCRIVSGRARGHGLLTTAVNF